MIRLFMILEALSFFAAASIHFGALATGYEHERAAIAEAVIGTVLVVGLAWSWFWPGATRMAGLLGQGFALLGTLVGAFTIAVGIGPRTVPDIVYHVTILLVLAWGLVIAARTPRGASETGAAQST